MRFSTICMVFGVCGLLSVTSCASVQKMEKEVKAELKDVKAADIKKDIEAVKKGEAPAAHDAKKDDAKKDDAKKDDAKKDASHDTTAKKDDVKKDASHETK